MLKVNEIFWSAQGEGLNSGTPAIFIRLAGCSLRCPYCDTRRAWSRGRDMDPAAVVAAAEELKAAYPQSLLVLTGGEPLEQDLKKLLTALKRRKYFVALETNGLHFQDLPFDWWTVSPKDVSAFRIHPRLWSKVSEVKLLVTPKLTLDVLIAMRGKTRAPIILQPQHLDRNRYRHAAAFYEKCIRAGLPAVRLGLQMHAIYSIR